jgi:hypothetical protein
LPQFDDFKYIANVARVNAASLAALALAPARPKNVLLTTGLSNHTELKWNANKEPDLAGYEIRLAGHDFAGMDKLALGWKRDELHNEGDVKGQLLLRRTRGRQGRESQPGHVSAAGATGWLGKHAAAKLRPPSRVGGRRSASLARELERLRT